ncbi:NADH-quinone oxidoreductase subunit J [Sphingobacterium sp. E70]|nr:NADH-quinone oxidoreductase subunit J [Sphingobacterium sp. E70]ULT22470.1 NADH-quinone oxidoreductase subunit J [Sphingobacterium sp. E70]
MQVDIDDCIVCDLCAKACPVDCIEIEAIKSPEAIGKTSDGSVKRLYPAKFNIDMAKCMYCGLCTVVCPTECIVMTNEYDRSSQKLTDLIYGFSDMTDEQVAQRKAEWTQFQAERRRQSKNKSMETILFYAFATLAIGSALLLVNLKNIARALFLFFIVLFAMAGLYLFALADFVAITQIMVYVGGVLILMLFAFMLSNKELLKDLQDSSGSFLSMPRWQAVVLAIGFLILMIFGIAEWHQSIPTWIQQAKENNTEIIPTDNNIQQIGLRFMTFYVLPFEVISVFLMMALIGASHLSRKERNR